LFFEEFGRDGSLRSRDGPETQPCIPFGLDRLGSTRYRKITTAAASATGNDQAHSPIVEMAIAATTHPSRKPNRRCSDRFNRPPSALISGGPFGSASMRERKVLGRLPVMTAGEMAAGIVRR